MTRPDYVIVGPDPRRTDVANPGGQLTATAGLLDYAEQEGLSLAFVDTLQGSFPPPPAVVRLTKAIRRQVQFLWYATARRPRKGALIFSAGPGSFMDRGLTGLIARIFRVRAVTCLRSGHLTPYLGASSFAGRTISALARTQARLVVQGDTWLPDLGRAGVDPARVRVVPNWISPAKRRAETPKPVPVDRPVCFVFVGWLVAEKGIRELLEACEQLTLSGQSFHLNLVGGGTLQHEVRQQIADKGLSDAITMEGWVDPSDVAAIMQQADVFVLPTHLEGFPNALIEAFALGLPAISTPVGAIPDSLNDGENGFLVPPCDVQSLADAMARYIQTPDLIASHSVKALETVREKHDFRTNCARLFAAVDD